VLYAITMLLFYPMLEPGGLFADDIARRDAGFLQTVRGSFAEGAPIYPGSKILQKAHIQIAVRDAACILQASRVKILPFRRLAPPSAG
jgi:hypothetical protein